MSTGKTGQQKVAENQVGVAGGQQNNDISTQNNFTQAQIRADEQAQSGLTQFEGPVQQSPFYKALWNTGISSTSKAYDNADTAMRQRAQQAGFGYNQPITQAGDNQLRAQEASDLGSLPDRALTAAAPLDLQASGQTAGLAGQEAGTAATYGNQSLGYGNELLNANSQAAALQARRQAQQQSLWQSIAGLTPQIIDSNPFGVFGG
jgi:hypothetical protein